jgi:hypothetical protein
MAKINYGAYRFPPVIIQQAIWPYVCFWSIILGLGMANNWLNCPGLVVEPFMQRRFGAHLGFFLAGLFSLGVLVFVAAINNRDGSFIEGNPK